MTKDNNSLGLLDLSYQDKFNATPPPPPYVNIADTATVSALPINSINNNVDTTPSGIINILSMLLCAVVSKMLAYPNIALMLFTLFTIIIFHFTLSNGPKAADKAPIDLASLIFVGLAFTFLFAARGREEDDSSSNTNIARVIFGFSAILLASSHFFYLKNLDSGSHMGAFILLWLSIAVLLVVAITVGVNQPRLHHP